MRYVPLLLLLFQLLLLGMQSLLTNAACCLPKVLAFKLKPGHTCSSISATISDSICVKNLCGTLRCCGKGRCNVFCCGCDARCKYTNAMHAYLEAYMEAIDTVLGLRLLKKVKLIKHRKSHGRKHRGRKHHGRKHRNRKHHH